MTAEPTPQELVAEEIEAVWAIQRTCKHPAHRITDNRSSCASCGVVAGRVDAAPTHIRFLLDALTAALDAKKEIAGENEMLTKWCREASNEGDRLRAELDNERLVSRVTDNALLTVTAELAEVKADVARALGWDVAEPWFAAVAQIHGQRDALAEAQELIRMLIATEGDLFIETKAKATVFLEGAG